MLNSGFVHNDHGGISILIRLTRFRWYVLQAIEELFFIDFTGVIIIIFANRPIVSQLTATIFGTWLPTMTEVDYDPDLPQPCRSEKLTGPLLYSMEWKNGMLLSAAVRAIYWCSHTLQTSPVSRAVQTLATEPILWWGFQTEDLMEIR
jgi:hypothetical protein